MRGYPTREEVHALLVPAGTTLGDVRVEDVVPSEDDAKFAAMSAAFGGGRGRVTAGEPIRTVYRGGTLWMSDTRDEWRDQTWFLGSVGWNGNVHDQSVLVTGLGLGMTPTALVLMGVKRIDVVEISDTVCELVGSHLLKIAADRGVEVHVHNADAYTWDRPDGVRWDWAWHDIWPFICSDNLPEMGKIRRRFTSRMTAPKRQQCWAEIECKRAKRREANSWW